MTEAKESDYLYLDRREDFEELHKLLSKKIEEDGDEPIGSFDLAKADELDSLLNISKQKFFGIEAYPTLAEKAAILFYSINKQQIFLNGNKRMSTLSLLVFLAMNGKLLSVTPDELTAKALWLATTESKEFQSIKKELTEWINKSMTNF